MMTVQDWALLPVIWPLERGPQGSKEWVVLQVSLPGEKVCISMEAPSLVTDSKSVWL